MSGGRTWSVITGGIGTVIGLFAALTPSTRESIMWAVHFFGALIARSPLGLWAVLLGMAVGWLGMLWTRLLIPPHVGLDAAATAKEGRRVLTWLVGLLGSLVPTYAVWPTAFGGWLGLTIGLASPWTWELILLLIALCSKPVANRLRGIDCDDPNPQSATLAPPVPAPMERHL